MDELRKTRKKIDMRKYTFKEYAEYFHLFHKKILCIVLVDRIIEVVITDAQLPHLIGLHYAYTKKSSQKEFKGQKGYDKLLENKIDIKTFQKRVIKNKVKCNGKIITWEMILDRIERLPCFLNNISKKPRLKQNQPNRIVNSSMKGDFFYFKIENYTYLILSILKVGKRYTLESFVVYHSIDILIDLKEIEILDIYWK